MTTFIVQLRSTETRSWGNQAEVQADSAAEAAEQEAGESLRQGAGVRSDLRARVWATPFGSQPEISFYRVPPEAN
ncbi:hypothetical protein [uncultured Enterovirga sp.]|uniref:hypothetical protein n=1 Tax=uncultured Enterovirga sp. TaxID=2026352 RepID=UPI0035C9CA56